jgi:site-specific DNA-methyltransferase (adenine-specific)
MARKPMKGSTTDNVLEHGVGALNIDATRIPTADTRGGGANGISRLTFGEGETSNEDSFRPYTPNEQGRYPSNVLGDIADYQKYFYCPKVSRRERHRGFEQEHIPDPLENYAQGDVKNHPLWDPSIGTNIQRLKHKILEHDKSLGRAHTVTQAVGNNHPTVKPVELMKYLIRLVTPAEAHILDPFAGSGTTGMACRELARRFTGIDLDRDYCEIARKRIAASQPDLSETLFE